MGQGLGQAQNPEVSTKSFGTENKRKVLKSHDFRTFMVAESRNIVFLRFCSNGILFLTEGNISVKLLADYLFLMNLVKKEQ